jgi:flagellar motor switch protein FliM
MAVIRRKTAAAAAAQAAGRGAAAHWPVALARAAQAAMGLDLEVEGAAAGPASLAEVLEVLPDHALIAALEGPAGATGAIALGPGLLTALVERQTLGRVTPRPVVPRRPTRTDAAIAAGLIDAALAALDTALEAEEDRVWAAGFRTAAHVDGARTLSLLLEDAGFRLIRARARAQGKGGEVILALPARGRGTPPPPPADQAAAMVFRAALGEQVMAAEAMLTAVIARVSLPLSQVMALAPGEVLRLGPAALDRVDLDGPDGIRVAGGRLGQTRSLRALRLDAAAAPAARGPGALSPGLATAGEALRRAG